MNKTMILAILVAYKAFNNKSLTIATDERVYSKSIINDINDIKDIKDIKNINDIKDIKDIKDNNINNSSILSKS